MQDRYNSQNEDVLIDDNHRTKRDLCRAGGIICYVIGGLFMIVGGMDFFSAFGGFGEPKLFWCFFVGMPFLFFGGALTSAGFAGMAARYMASEIAPISKDAANYMADGISPSVEKLAGAVGRGLSEAMGGVVHAGPGGQGECIRCQKCNHVNGSDAKFCSNCGYSLKKNYTCPACGELNDPDAKFCDNCGRSVAQDR